MLDSTEALGVDCVKVGTRRMSVGPKAVGVIVRPSTRMLSRIIIANVAGMSGHLFANTTSHLATTDMGLSNLPSVDHKLRNQSTNMSIRGMSNAFNATPGVEIHNTASVCNGSGPL